MAKLKLSNEFMAMGGGAAVGTAQVIIFEKYIDPNYGTIPFIGDYVPAPWNKWSTLGNIIIGGAALAIAKFTKFGGRKNIRYFLGTYGISTLVGGAIEGILTPGIPGRARAMATAARAVAPVRTFNGPRAPVPTGGLTPTGISGQVVVA